MHELGEPLARALLLGALLAYRSDRRRTALALWDMRQRASMPLDPGAPARVHLGAWLTTGDTALAAPFASWRRAIPDGSGAATGGDETVILALAALLALLLVVGVAALRLTCQPPPST